MRVGLGTHDARTLRSAGLLHDLGRAGVAMALWDKGSGLSAVERAHVERHPALTEAVLAHSSRLGRLAVLAGLHHERLDGSGYRSVAGPSLSAGARVLAAADAYQALVEGRPGREELSPDDAAAAIMAEVAAGRLDGDAARGVLEMAGRDPGPAARGASDEDAVDAAPPAGLSPDDVAVLRLMIRGRSAPQIGARVGLSPKAVDRQIERIYQRIDVSTRVGATLFAIEHGLVAGPPPPLTR